MTGSTVGIWIIVAVVVLGLAVWLITVARAARRPGQEHPKGDQVRGVVQGGQHIGGGRSVAPTRDAPVPEGGGDPPALEEQDPANTGQRPPGRGSPMDL